MSHPRRTPRRARWRRGACPTAAWTRRTPALWPSCAASCSARAPVTA